MEEIEYKNWKKSRTALLLADGETEDFIEYFMNWMDHIKGRRECDLLQKYHPTLSNENEDTIYDFMHIARYFPENLPRKDFSIQVMDSAFFLYRPCLKMEYIDYLIEEVNNVS
jgi:hypothetical protein